MTDERGNGVELTGPVGTGSVKAHGRSAILFLGFLVVAAAIIYDGWQGRAATTAQTQLIGALIANQREFIEGYTTTAAAAHVELKGLCLRERFSESLRK